MSLVYKVTLQTKLTCGIIFSIKGGDHLDGLLNQDNVTLVVIFLEGVFSFLSPCVLPLLPLYMSYLAGGAAENQQKKVLLLNTLCFVVGISTAFFLLGMAFSSVSLFLQDHRDTISVIGGILIILLGLMQIGIFKTEFLQRERRFYLPINLNKMNAGVAFLLGFTFSFAWTPCIGPAMSSVLIMASGAQDMWVGNLLILVYTSGFIIPFLILGLFTTKVLQILEKYKAVFRWLIKLGGVLLVAIGIMLATGMMNAIGSYLAVPNTGGNSVTDQAVPSPAAEKRKILAKNFSLTDQYGKVHTLAEYKGKVIFLNFWATWCPPCRQEMPHIEELYKRYNLNKNDVIVLGVANPKTATNRSQDGSEADIKAFLANNNYTFPVVFDESGEIFAAYAIRALPTTFMIDRDGNVIGYASGALSASMMQDIVEKALMEGK